MSVMVQACSVDPCVFCLFMVMYVVILISHTDHIMTCIQSVPDPMHTLPLGVSRHIIQATVWVIKEYIMSLQTWQADELTGSRMPFFSSKQVQSVITRICDRFLIIRMTCHGMDLTTWMCQELNRVYASLLAGKHNMSACFRSH